MKNFREAPIDIAGDEFRKLAHQLVDSIAEFIDTIREKPVTPGESPKQLQALLENASLPENGLPANEIFSRASGLLFDHSLFNGHPKFFGYITSSAAPIGALADLLAASVNPNVGANILSPMATEIEKQTIKWLAEFIGVPPSYGGVLVSGGNMANFTGFLAGRTVKAPKAIKENGMIGTNRLMIYCSQTTHTWIEKAAVLFGFGTGSVRWIPATEKNKMDLSILQDKIEEDIRRGHKPLIVVGTAGDVSTGAVDDLQGISRICKKHDLWFHVDGAYGMPAAVIPELRSSLFAGIEGADSIALDPHKWLYSPLEAGCTLVKDPNSLIETYSSHPVYYNFSNDDEPSTVNFYEYGFQNSRGFRALKVWVALQQVGRKGYEKMIGDDIELSKLLYSLAAEHPELEAISQNLSIATFRYVPRDITDNNSDSFLNTLNETLLNRLQQNGELFLSNAVVNGKYCLRCCIVNFRTSKADIEKVIEIVVGEGRKISDSHEYQVKAIGDLENTGSTK